MQTGSHNAPTPHGSGAAQQASGAGAGRAGSFKRILRSSNATSGQTESSESLLAAGSGSSASSIPQIRNIEDAIQGVPFFQAQKPPGKSTRRASAHRSARTTTESSQGSHDRHITPGELVPKQGSSTPARKEERTPISHMTLPEFHRQRPRIFWPFRDKEPAPVDVDLKPVSPGSECRDFWRETAGQSGKSSVHRARFKREVIRTDGILELEDEWLAVKLRTELSDAGFKEAYREATELRDLKHNHIIAVVGAYEDPQDPPRDEPIGTVSKKLGIILFPLAVADLAKYMSDISRYNGGQFANPHPKAKHLMSFFPCLCRALLYLHSKLVKHKDVKPANILVSNDGPNKKMVILADFDIAGRYKEPRQAQTLGLTNITPRYAPGNVEGGHGFSRDVVSLGFVFLEMATVLLGETLENLAQYLLGAERCESCPEFHESDACPNLAGPSRPNHRTHASGTTELIYSDRLERIELWIGYLADRPKTKRQLIPKEVLSKPGYIQGLLQMLLPLMKTGGLEEDGKMLKEAWRHYSGLVERCQHCHPQLNTFGLAEPPTKASRATTLQVPAALSLPVVPERVSEKLSLELDYGIAETQMTSVQVSSASLSHGSNSARTGWDNQRTAHGVDADTEPNRPRRVQNISISWPSHTPDNSANTNGTSPMEILSSFSREQLSALSSIHPEDLRNAIANLLGVDAVNTHPSPENHTSEAISGSSRQPTRIPVPLHIIGAEFQRMSESEVPARARASGNSSLDLLHRPKTARPPIPQKNVVHQPKTFDIGEGHEGISTDSESPTKRSVISEYQLHDNNDNPQARHLNTPRTDVDLLPLSHRASTFPTGKIRIWNPTERTFSVVDSSAVKGKIMRYDPKMSKGTRYGTVDSFTGESC
ncbi:hypothetical protein EJ03DRAFT_76343 [Teratosphaeria nubilosa]|uniref:Protein kinase domain-containing protein n=1 Tax=Teratosphaeria nubilosa TaxID=161662 RepID=A0A6G1LC91_9PEZI|nr:hypothetical protein EJ03DRAFT_76343 [Teratosphaeria nubilosa]